MLAATVKREATDPFFKSDSAFEAGQAAADFGCVVEHESTSNVVASFGAIAPSDWTESGARLRALVSAYRAQPGPSADGQHSPSADAARAQRRDTHAGPEQRGTQVPHLRGSVAVGDAQGADHPRVPLPRRGWVQPATFR